MVKVSENKQIITCKNCNGYRNIRASHRYGDDTISTCEKCGGEGSVFEITTVYHEKIENTDPWKFNKQI